MEEQERNRGRRKGYDCVVLTDDCRGHEDPVPQADSLCRTGGWDCYPPTPRSWGATSPACPQAEAEEQGEGRYLRWDTVHLMRTAHHGCC